MAINDVHLPVRARTARLASVSGGVLASVGDPGGTRTVTSIIALLVALGVALVMLAIWLYRSTRPDPELLAPLEVMGERKWRRGDPVWQRRRLDEIRPTGAVPLDPSIAPPDVDEAFDQGPSAAGFDDLHDAAVHATDERSPADSVAPSPVSAPQSTDTPEAISRPDLDELPGSELDPEVLAEAIAELDAELGHDQR